MIDLPEIWIRPAESAGKKESTSSFYNLHSSSKLQLKCLGFTYNGAKLFNMLPIKMKKMEDPNTFKTMTKDWIWENIPSY